MASAFVSWLQWVCFESFVPVVAKLVLTKHVSFPGSHRGSPNLLGWIPSSCVLLRWRLAWLWQIDGGFLKMLLRRVVSMHVCLLV